MILQRLGYMIEIINLGWRINPLAHTLESLGIDQMSVEDRIALATAIWDSIRLEPSDSLITPVQKSELQRRLQEHAIHPENVVPWEQVKAEALARFEG